MSSPIRAKQPQSRPEQRIAPSVDFEEGLKETLRSVTGEGQDLLAGPGDVLNLYSGQRISARRSEIEQPTPHTGIHYQKGKTPSVTDVPNPDSPDGRWDPYAHMPRFVFDAKEDAFPVSPTFDGDVDMDNNGPSEPDSEDGNYKDGVIGGKQPLSGGFAVSKKGEYTVLTYSFYYAHNKAQHYHENDYSTAQVYLKPGEDGKLEPAYMSTSWHHGSVLTRWEDLKKDANGRPIIGVQPGTHALQPFGKGQELPEKGLQIRGDGRASLDGRPLEHQLSFEAFQKNVAGARWLDPKSPDSVPRLEAMRWGDVGFNPLLPEVYHHAPSTWSDLAKRGGRIVLEQAEKVEDAVSKVTTPVRRAGSWAADKLKGAFSSL